MATSPLTINQCRAMVAMYDSAEPIAAKDVGLTAASFNSLVTRGFAKKVGTKYTLTDFNSLPRSWEEMKDTRVWLSRPHTFGVCIILTNVDDEYIYGQDGYKIERNKVYLIRPVASALYEGWVPCAALELKAKERIINELRPEYRLEPEGEEDE